MRSAVHQVTAPDSDGIAVEFQGLLALNHRMDWTCASPQRGRWRTMMILEITNHVLRSLSLRQRPRAQCTR